MSVHYKHGLCRHYIPSLTVSSLLLSFGFGTLPAAYAQSPTDTFIRVQMHRVGNLNPPKSIAQLAHIEHSTLSSHGGMIVSRVTVSARTEAEARHAAQRHAYSAALERALPTTALRQVSALRREIALAVSQLKTTQASIIATRKIAEGYEAVAEIQRTPHALLMDFCQEGLPNYRALICLHVTSTSIQTNSPADVEENALEGALTDAGFSVFDRKLLANAKESALLTDADEVRPAEEVQQASIVSMCGIVVLGSVDVQPSQNTEGIVSCSANLQLRVLQGSSGQVILTRRYSEKGFGMSVDQAGQAALEKLTKTASAKLPKAITAQLRTFQTTVLLSGSGTTGASDIATFLRSVSGVQSVESITANGESCLVISTTENPAYLGIRLANTAGVESIQYGTEAEVGETH